MSSPAISIFVAEDDLDDVFFFEEAVKKLGIKIDLAFFENGRTLIENLYHCGGLPSLIFLDLNMPEMNGFEACKEILSDPELKAVPLIILTTSGDESDRKLCLDHGAKDFITKPAGIDELSKILKELIDKWVIKPRPSMLPDRKQHLAFPC